MGKTGETCGAVTGALMIISLKEGIVEKEDGPSKDGAAALAEKFMKEFKTRNTSVVCRELLGFQIGPDSGADKYRIISEKCPRFVRVAAEIIEDILK